ncbi:MAG: VWA domain-containing protein [Ardenticatenaceae bacterium]
MRKLFLFVFLSLLLAFGGKLFMLGSATQLEASVDEGAVSLGQPPGIAPTSLDASQSTASQDVNQGLESTTAVSEFDNQVTSSSPKQGPTSRTYTLDADFDEGILVNVNHDVADQLQLDDPLTAFRFIWIALSGRGTIVKVDTLTGEIKGEYYSAPDGRGKSPSRTTVDLNGNVWSGNRAETQGGLGSAVHVALSENNQCVDRNGNGVIDTSTGLGDILAWPNTGGADDNGGVSTAVDECIIHYVRVGSRNTRHTSVDADNNVWIGGNNSFAAGNRRFDLVDGTTGNVLDSAGPFNCGGYGGLVDSNGILWSSRGAGLLRYDPATDTGTCIPVGNSYGMAVDSQGHIWNAQWTSNTVTKVDAAGNIVATYSTGGSASRGVAITADDHVWIANSSSDTVTRLDNSGNLLASIPVGSEPTGVAVDTVGKVWVTNLGSSNAMRIDPATNTVDLTVDLGAGANPYNYSDMTGIVALRHTSPQGTWTVIHDSGAPATPWGVVSWNSDEPLDSSVTVRVRSAETVAGLGSATYIWVTNGVDFDVPHGRYLQIESKLRPASDETSPILYDLTVESGVNPPECRVEHDKVAMPHGVRVGGATTVTLSLRGVGDCEPENTPVDVMLVIDRSGSMRGASLADAKAATTEFVNLMSLSRDQVGVVSFATDQSGALDSQLTQNATAANTAINGLTADGFTDIEEGLMLAADEILSSGRHISENAPVIILVTDGRHNEFTPGQLQATANSIRMQGIRIIAIGFGPGIDVAQLQGIASSQDDYYEAPNSAQLTAIYQQIAPTIRVAARDMVLTDTLSAFVDLIPGTFQGPISPTVQGDTISWQIGGVPIEPTLLSYQVSVKAQPGVWPTNEIAYATYVDAQGNDADLLFPVPQVVVREECGEPDLTDIEPMWACVDQSANVTLHGSHFFVLSDSLAADLGITGTWDFDAFIGPQELNIQHQSKNLVEAMLPPGLGIGTYDVTVKNTCGLTQTEGTYTETLPIEELPPPIMWTDVLTDKFTIYPVPTVEKIRPAEGYGNVPSPIWICGAGFTPDTKAYIIINGQKVLLEDQSLGGDTCIGATIPAGLDPGNYTIQVTGLCGEEDITYTVLSSELNDDLWGLGENLVQDPAFCPRENEDISVSLIVYRRGGRQALENVTVRFYEGHPSEDNLIGDGNIPLLPRVTPDERINGFNTSFASWEPSNGAGEYHIYGVIDPDNNITEDIETNNVVSRTLQVLPHFEGADEVAPRVDVLTIDGGEETTYDTEVALHVESEDLVQPGAESSEVARLQIVEYLYSESANIWTSVGASGWQTYTQDLDYDLFPIGGMRFLQAWTADAHGNISRSANQKFVNYIPPCTSVSRNGTKVYRRSVEAGDQIQVQVTPCEGDPDLYIWPSDWVEGQPPFVSNRVGNHSVETLDIPVDATGEWEIEVYGFTAAKFTIEIQVIPGGARASTVEEHRSGKPIPSAPSRGPRDPRDAPSLPPGNAPDSQVMRAVSPIDQFEQPTVTSTPTSTSTPTVTTVPSTPTSTPTATSTASSTSTPTPTNTTMPSMPTVTPLATVSADISPGEGGTMTSPNDQVQVDFPSGAVSTNTMLTYGVQSTPSQDTGSLLFAGVSFQLHATDANGNTITNFNQKFTIRIEYNDQDLLEMGIAEESLSLFFWDGSQWVDLMTSCAQCSLDMQNNVLTIALDHLTEFALLGQAAQNTPTPTSTATLTPIPSTTAGFPFEDGFELGTLGRGWSIETTEQGSVSVDERAPSAGAYGVLLQDAIRDQIYSTAALILTIDLDGQSDVRLDFSWREFIDENDEQDGVFLSDNQGANWHQVLSFNNGSDEFSLESLHLDQLAAENGLTFNEQFQIKFQFYDNHPVDSDGYAIDEVRVYRNQADAATPTDEYESDNSCGQATAMVADGNKQQHTFHDMGDEDWVKIEASSTITYVIEARVPSDSLADISLELHESCEDSVADDEQDHHFAADVRMLFNPPIDGTYYLRLLNHDPNVYGTEVAYTLSVREPPQNAGAGALILVAGKLRDNDPVQPNIYQVTDAVYNFALQEGCSAEQIHYLAPDTSRNGVDEAANKANLEKAITEWAPTQVGADRPLTIFMMDHGGENQLYLDGRNEAVNARQLDQWLTDLESRVGRVETNVVVEACLSGSFISEPQSLSLNHQNRAVISSTGEWVLAYASQKGAVFSDAFLGGLRQGMDLGGAFDKASQAASVAHPDQSAWLDDNGDGRYTDSDGQIVAQRGFACAAPPIVEAWAPYIMQTEVRNNNQIWAEVVDDKAVSEVRAVIYPPSYSPKDESEELLAEPAPVILTETENENEYGLALDNLKEPGTYRIVLYADDQEGLTSQPKEVMLEVQSGYNLYLPTVIR